MDLLRLVVVRSIVYILFVVLLSCSDSNGISENEISDDTIVGKYGQLSIEGNNIVDKNGKTITLRGMSLFWSQWAPDYYNEETIKWLRDDWKCTVIRVAMGVESGGYLENPELEYWKVKTVIDACIEYGIYVLIDWHDHHGENHIESAITFFRDISSEYGQNPNIIYELYNEPLDVSWQNVLKPFSETVISEIRKNDPNNIIIIGTPNWSQDVDDVIGSEIDDNNVAYSLHFYTGTHREWLRAKAAQAMSAGVPLFVTEWGLSKADATGNIDIAETNLWTNFMESTNLSWCNWSVNNKDETTSILLPSTTSVSGCDESELSEAGKFIKEYLIRMNSSMFE